MPKRSNRRSRKGKSRRQGQMRPSEARPPRGISDTYRFSRQFLALNGVLTAGSPFLQALVLQPAASFPSTMSTFVQRYDLFRIESVDIFFYPRYNVSAAGAVNDEQVPQIAIVVNYDDPNTPTSVDNVLAQGNSTMERFVRPIRRRVQPRALIPVQLVGGIALAGNLLSAHDAWYNAAIVTTNVIFPMIKFAITATTLAPGGGAFDVWYKVNLVLAQHLA